MNKALGMNMPDGAQVYFEDGFTRDAISDAYSSSNTYAKGDYCIYDNVLYRCTTAIATPEEWTAGHWSATTVGSEVSTLNNSLTNLADSLGFDAESVLDLSNSTTFTATKAGYLRGYFRKTADNTNVGQVGILSNKNGNSYIYIQSLPKEVNGGYCPIDLFVVKGETVTFNILTNINISSSRVAFTPLTMDNFTAVNI